MAFSACRTRHLSRVLYLTTLLVATSPVLLSHSGRLKGRVLNGAGNPIHEAQVEVYLWQHSELLVTTTTDHKGRFQFSGLPPGQLEIVAFKEGLEPQTALIDGEDRDREIEVILEAAYPSLSFHFQTWCPVQLLGQGN